jgi:hypothetical protein
MGVYCKICITIEIVLISVGKQTIITVRQTMVTFIHRMYIHIEYCMLVHKSKSEHNECRSIVQLYELVYISICLNIETKTLCNNIIICLNFARRKPDTHFIPVSTSNYKWELSTYL